jgi:hypothetical protein
LGTSEVRFEAYAAHEPHVVYRGSQAAGPVDSVAIKQLYASHYFETALDLSVCVTAKK